MESGTPGFGLPFRSLAEAERIGDAGRRPARPGRRPAQVARGVAVPALLAVDRQFATPGRRATASSGCGPRSTGVLPAAPERLARPGAGQTGDRRQQPARIGYARRPGRIATSSSPTRSAPTSPLRAPSTGSTPRRAEPDPRLRVGSTTRLRPTSPSAAPRIAWREIMAARGGPSGIMISTAATDGAQSAHAAEIPYAFGDLDAGLGRVAEALLDQLHPQR